MMLTVLGTLAIVLATIIAGMVVDRRWSLLPRKERLLAAAGPKQLGAPHGPGEAPETALALSPGEVERLRRAQRHCRAPMEIRAEDEVSYEGRTLRVLRFACAGCGAQSRLYVEA